MSDDIPQAPVLTWTGNGWVPTMEVSDDEDDLPDSAVAQFRIAEGSGDIISDNLVNEVGGVADGDNYTWVNNDDYEGMFALTGDTEETFIFNSEDPFTFQDFNSNFTAAFTYRHSANNTWIYTTAAEEDNFDDVLLLSGREDVDDGYLWELRVGGSEITQGVDVSFTDGELYRIVNEVDVDNIQVDVTINKVSQDETEGERPSYSARNELQVSDFEIDHLVFYDGLMTEDEIEMDYNAQPWT